MKLYVFTMFFSGERLYSRFLYLCLYSCYITHYA
jgi:hypothetical protein